MVRLCLLGGFRLARSGAPAAPLAKRRAEAVLAVLAVCGDRGCTREWLIALLWPESDEDRSRHGLRDALHVIRGVLGSAVPSGSRLLQLDSSAVQSDVQTFGEAVAAGRYADAVKAYGGPLLEGFHVDGAPEFERWLDGERIRLARDYGEALNRLATAAENAEDWEKAAGWWARAVEHDPVNSHLVLQHMRALEAMGDPANAIKAAEVHARRLHQELDLGPDRAVATESDRIRLGRTNGTPGASPPARDRAKTGLPGPETSPLTIEPTLASGDAARSPSKTSGMRKVRRSPAWAVVVMSALVGIGLLGSRWMETRGPKPVHPRTAIALLPFQNLTADSVHGSFAAGLHDELLTQLAKVAALKVIGRTSVSEYQDPAKSLREIGEELAVGSIVEGTVQIDVDAGRLRVVVQLLDPTTQETLWGERYDRPLDDAFALQSEIARHIVNAVGARLTSAEAGAMSAAPTGNPQAYHFYLQGLDYQGRPGALRQNFESAQPLFERSLALDSSFAPTHAALALTHYYLYDLGYDESPDRFARARREADEAVRLAPDLPETRLVAGLVHHRARRDYPGALNQFRLGLQAAPNDAELWGWLGRVHRRLGNWDSVFFAFERARALDPRATNLLHSIGNTYHQLHRYREAIDAYRQELMLAPDLVQPRLSLAWSYVLWKGELDTLRAVLRSLPPDSEIGHGGTTLVHNRLALVLFERRGDSVLSLVRTAPELRGSDPQSVLGRSDWTIAAHLLRGDTAAAQAMTDSVGVVLDAQARDGSNDLDFHAERGHYFARIGRKAAALREVRWLEQWERMNGDQYGGFPEARVKILMLTGEMDSAFALLERLMLAPPSLVTVHYLRLDPRYDPITQHPRFQALFTKYADQRN